MRALKATLWGAVIGAAYGAAIGCLAGLIAGMGFSLTLPSAVLAALFIGIAGLGGSIGEPN